MFFLKIALLELCVYNACFSFKTIWYMLLKDLVMTWFKMATWLLLGQGGRLDDFTKSAWSDEGLAAGAKSLLSCLTLCDPIDGSPPGCPVPGILQAGTREWVAIAFSSAWKWNVEGKSLSGVPPSATPGTAAHQAPLSVGFSRQEHWSGVPSPSETKDLGTRD